MNNTTSQLSLNTSYCHNISEENYFLSPKMPVKDHSLAFKSPTMTPKQPETYVLISPFRSKKESSTTSTSTTFKNLKLSQKASTPCPK